MKTTELFVEQVLIGALVLAAALLPWWREVSCLLGPNGIGTVGAGVAALGVAYLLGIPCDRLADTLTEDLERHHRLRFALAWPALRDVAPPHKETSWKDPFPEDDLRLKALRDAEPVVAWLDYHRSRVRLPRALTAFVPATAFAAVLTVARLAPAPGWAPELRWIVLVPVVYGLVVLLGRQRRDRAATLDARRPVWPLAPRTNQPEAYNYGHDQGFGLNDDVSRRRRSRSMARVLLEDPAVQGAAALHAMAIALALATGRAATVEVALGGVGLTMLSAWSWWRISATYRYYLRQVGRMPLEPRHS